MLDTSKTNKAKKRQLLLVELNMEPLAKDVSPRESGKNAFVQGAQRAWFNLRNSSLAS